MSILQKEQVLDTKEFSGSGKVNGSDRIAVDLLAGENTFTVNVVDIYGYTYTESKTILVG